MNIVVDRVQAEKEVNGWLDFKKITPKKREDNKGNIEKIIEGIMYGQLIVDEKTFNIEHTLSFPVGKETVISKLVYKPRVKTSVFQQHCKNLDVDDSLGRVYAYIAGMADSSKSLIGELEQEDYLLGSQIAFFFMA